MKVSAVCAVFPAASVPVTVSVGDELVPCNQANAFETYGPPAGVDTAEAVCDQRVLVPPSAAVVEDAGAVSLSVTALASLKEPPPETLPL